MNSLARIISFITNPIFILFPIPYLLVYRFGFGHILAIKWTLFTFFFLFLAGIFVIYEVKNKVFSDMDVSKREQRPLLFLVIAGITVIYFFSLFFFQAPPVMFFTVWGVMVGILAASVINTKIKVSLHVAAITAVTLTITKMYDLPIYFFLIVPLVGWARIKIRRHSVTEVITGFLFGCSLPIFMYILLKYIYKVSL